MPELIRKITYDFFGDRYSSSNLEDTFHRGKAPFYFLSEIDKYILEMNSDRANAFIFSMEGKD